MQVQSLGWEDLLEEKMATSARMLAWKTQWTEEPGGLQRAHGVAKSHGLQRAKHNRETKHARIRTCSFWL